MNLPKTTDLEALKNLVKTLRGNYLKKTDAQELIKKAIAESGHTIFESVDTIPDIETAKDNVLYLVPNEKSGVLDIYAKVGDTVKKLSDTNIDLSEYVKKEQGKGLISEEEKTKLSGVAENATKVEIGEEPGTILINGEKKVIFEVATEEEIQAVIDRLLEPIESTEPSQPEESGEENT